MLLDGALADEQAPGDPAVGVAFGHQCQHLALAGRQLRERIVATPLGDELVDEGGIDLARTSEANARPVLAKG